MFSMFQSVLIVFIMWIALSTCLLEPKLLKVHNRQFQSAGSRFKFFCYTQQGAKPFSFEWFRDGQTLSPSDNQIEVNSDESLLTIQDLTTNHGGNYSCIVRNQHGSDSQYTFLTVTGLSLLFIS